MNLVYSLAVFLGTFTLHNLLGAAAERNPALMGGPLVDGNMTSRMIYAAGGAASLLALFWNRLAPILWRYFGGGTSEPTTPYTDIISIIQAILGSDARLAVLQPLLKFFLGIPQVIAMIQALVKYGWPDYFYFVVAYPGKVFPAAGGTLPANLPMPTAPPVPIVTSPVVPKTDPPQVLTVVTGATGEAAP